MMPDHDSSVQPQPSQFLSDSGAYLVRMANLTAFPLWEGVELRFDAQPLPEGAGLLLTARLRSGDRRIGRRVFSIAEPQDTPRLPHLVEEWVRGLEAPE